MCPKGLWLRIHESTDPTQFLFKYLSVDLDSALDSNVKPEILDLQLIFQVGFLF